MARKDKSIALPVYKAFVPDPDDATKLFQIGVTKPFKSGKGFRLCGEDDPAVRQLAYEHVHEMMFLLDRD
jgi:hypothetical protein